MGHYVHHAIVATFYSHAKGEAEEIFEEIGRIMHERLPDGIPALLMTKAPLNAWTTIMLAPDGSQEGWHESDIMDEIRDLFVSRLRALEYWDDGQRGAPVKWFEVAYGDDHDDGPPTITRSFP